MNLASRLLWSVLLATCCVEAQAQQLQTRFACSATREEDGQRALYADSGEIRIDGSRIEAFHWESALYRRTHGFDCSIDEGDGLQAEVRAPSGSWRVMLADARAARDRRGYDFDHGLDCSIRLERNGNTLQVTPSCPALCGSRANFSTLSVNLKAGACRYK